MWRLTWLNRDPEPFDVQASFILNVLRLMRSETLRHFLRCDLFSDSISSGLQTRKLLQFPNWVPVNPLYSFKYSKTYKGIG